MCKIGKYYIKGRANNQFDYDISINYGYAISYNWFNILMIYIDVKTKYNNQVAIRDKYIKKAKKNKEDIYIVFGNDAMIISYKDLKNKITGTTGPFEDRFSQEEHYLIYFKWIPNVLKGEELTKKMFGY